MYYVYFLKSLKNGDVYVGSTQSLNTRISRHNKGFVRSTKHYRPWKLLGFEVYDTRSEAARREVFLKSGRQKEGLKRKYFSA